MGVLSTILNVVGLILLTHAVYSAYEHALLPAAAPLDPSASSPSSAAAPAPASPYAALPTDITAETLISVLLLCVGVVLGAPELRPIQWRVWAGRIEREKRKPLRNLDEGVGGNPFVGLEERSGFLDIRAQRREFAEWVKEGKR